MLLVLLLVASNSYCPSVAWRAILRSAQLNLHIDIHGLKILDNF